MKRVLVTGAGGYIGTTLVPMLLDAGYRVRAVDRFFFGEERLRPHPALEVVQEDVRRIAPARLEDVDAVIDLAALSNDASGELVPEWTWQINHRARVRLAGMAKAAGVSRYILPSSCSIYGFQDPAILVDEESPTNPLTTYAQANEQAEHGVLPLASDGFCVTVIRQATVYGYSARMRFDLAINGMTYGAWKTGVLPLMRDGSQWRPMVHVSDTARAMCFLLDAPPSRVNGEVFNVGSDENNYQLGDLAERVARAVPRDVAIEWYGDPDHRSYRVSFAKIESLGYRAERVAEDGVTEICAALEAGTLDRTTDTITIDWYKQLLDWQERIRRIEMYGGILDIGAVTDDEPAPAAVPAPSGPTATR
ncbi:MAG: SDR family oxidoreductase [Dehalococcoidia bacterium]